MRHIFFLSALSSMILISACKSDSKQTEEESVDIIGFWEGTYTTDGRPDLEPQYLNFLIKSDGTVTNESSFMSEIRINTGTWELSGAKFKIQISNIYGGDTPNPQMGTAEFDSSGILKNGIIKNMSGTGSAAFEMVKRK